jgi:predicted helicase
MLSPDDIKVLQKTFGDLYSKLKSVFWAASTEGRVQIQGPIDVVNKVLDQLDKAGLEADNDAIDALTDSLRVATKNLGDLQKQVDQIVHNVHVATEVVGAIDKAVSIAGKVITAV